MKHFKYSSVHSRTYQSDNSTGAEINKYSLLPENKHITIYAFIRTLHQVEPTNIKRLLCSTECTSRSEIGMVMMDQLGSNVRTLFLSSKGPRITHETGESLKAPV